ncbi:helix-turn-helix domain-containing protein [Alkalibacterium sp. f15]|uniref:helix-turn-helix domain-containing protein n=1 Tax=Alkalibacterium sp. f15 TaxID=3414029 RepID=UPI003BF84B1D
MNEIGDKLKEARKAKGYTLDDLQQMTKIQKRYLIAVEEGNLEVLPGNFYARAFIKQYADSVGLNGEALIQEHMDALPQTQNNTSYTKSVDKSQTRSKSKKSGFVATLRDSLPTLLIIILVIAIIFAIYLAVTTVDNSDFDSFIKEDESASVIEVDDNEEAIIGEDEDETTNEEENQDDITNQEEDSEENSDDEEETDEKQAIDETTSTDTATTYSISGNHPSEQQVVLTSEGGDSWVSITVDGETANQGLIEDGESLITSFDDTASNIAIVIGNASTTSILLNDQEVPYKSSGNEKVRQEVFLEFE